MPLGNMQQSLRTCWAPNQKGFPIPATAFLLVPIMDIPKRGRKWHNNTQRKPAPHPGEAFAVAAAHVH